MLNAIGHLRHSRGHRTAATRQRQTRENKTWVRYSITVPDTAGRETVMGIGGVLTAERSNLQRDWHVIVQARKADRLVLPAGSVIVRTVECERHPGAVR